MQNQVICLPCLMQNLITSYDKRYLPVLKNNQSEFSNSSLDLAVIIGFLQNCLSFFRQYFHGSSSTPVVLYFIIQVYSNLSTAPQSFAHQPIRSKVTEYSTTNHRIIQYCTAKYIIQHHQLNMAQME